jgi:DNA-binding LacI/PurR family transcriptional regulator
LSAIGVLHAVMNQGLMVPDYLSVIGFDNIRLAAYTYPPLTTVDMPRDELAVSAVQALISMIEGGVAPPRKEITTQLVVRRTTGTPRLARLTPPRGPRIVTV